MRGTALRSYRRRMTPQQPSNRGVSSQRSGSEIQAIGAVAGMIGPILFTVGFVVQGLFRRGEYDPVAETVSALEAGPNGWVQQLNFLRFRILMMIFACRARRRAAWRASAHRIRRGHLLGSRSAGRRSLSASRGFRRPNLRSHRGSPTERRSFLLEHLGWFGRLVLVPATRASLAGSGPIHTAHKWGVGGPVSRYGRSRDLVFSSVASMGRSHPTSRVGGVVSLPYCAGGSAPPGKPVRIGNAGCRAYGVGRLDSRFVEIGKDVGNCFVRGLATAVKPVANLGSLPSQHLVQGSG